MGAVADFDYRTLGGKVFSKLRKYYSSGRFDDWGSSYSIKKQPDGKITLALEHIGNYRNGPVDDSIISEVTGGKFTGNVDMWGKTPGVGFSFSEADRDPWEYSYLNLCFKNNVLFAAIIDKKVIWSTYPLETVKQIITDAGHDFDLYYSIDELTLMDPKDVSKIPFRKRYIPPTPEELANRPTFTFTEKVDPKAESFYHDWLDSLGLLKIVDEAPAFAQQHLQWNKDIEAKVKQTVSDLLESVTPVFQEVVTSHITRLRAAYGCPVGEVPHPGEKDLPTLSELAAAVRTMMVLEDDELPGDISKTVFRLMCRDLEDQIQNTYSQRLADEINSLSFGDTALVPVLTPEFHRHNKTRLELEAEVAEMRKGTLSNFSH